MIISSQRYLKINHDDASGTIRTEFKRGILGAIAGIVFKMTIETNQGKGLVVYLIKDKQVDEIIQAIENSNGEWMDASGVLGGVAANN